MTNTASNTERRGYLNVNTSNNLIMASGRIENQTPYYTWQTKTLSALFCGHCQHNLNHTKRFAGSGRCHISTI